MENAINLQEFLSSKTILHSETASEFDDALRILIEDKPTADIITYNHTRHFLLSSMGVLEKDIDEHSFYEFTVEKSCDIVDNIRFETASNLTVQLSYNIGGINYTPEELDEFVIVSSQYNNLTIRITFLEEPTADDEFNIISQYYFIINLQYRRLLETSTVITKSNIYSNGICVKNVI